MYLASDQTTSAAAKATATQAFSPAQTFDTDLIVIGCGPAGKSAAIQAAKNGRSVTVIDSRGVEGGVCLHTGTIPSKTLREAVIRLKRQKHEAHQEILPMDMTGLRNHVDAVIAQEVQVIRDQLARNGIRFISGHGQLIDPNHVEVTTSSRFGDTVGTRSFTLSAANTVLATGSKPRRPDNVAFDGKKILESDDILKIDRIPKSMLVIGGGVVGTEYASMFAALGTKVSIVEKAETILGFMDPTMIDWFQRQLKTEGVEILNRREVKRCFVNQENGKAVCEFVDGQTVEADVLLFAGGRDPATDKSGVKELEIAVNERGQVKVDAEQRTNIATVYAAGDVIGPPTLASTSFLQGRRAAAHAFGDREANGSPPLPVGIYAIPEISYVGKTEDKLIRDKIPYVVGLAHYGETGRGPIVGEVNGILKLLVHSETREILGVHIGGYLATELIHIGQAMIGLKGSLSYLIDSAFNYPTFAECYQIAAFRCDNELKRRAKRSSVS